jgi:nitrate/nitrite transporter NarK
MEEHNYPPAYRSWIILGLAIAFYFSGFFHRMVTAVMADQLMMDFNIGAAALGNFSSFYYYSYAAVQIPTGIIADHWGPRKLLTCGTFLSSIGAIVFATASTIFTANLGRLIIGASMGVAWVSILKLTTRWFKPESFTLVTGIALGLGIFGAISAGFPLRILMNFFGWRAVITGVGIATLLLGIAIWTFLRDEPAQIGYDNFDDGIILSVPGSKSSILKDLIKVFRYKNTWILTFIPATLAGPYLTFTGLWGVPYLSTHFQMTPAKSAALISILLICCALGGPISGVLSEKIGRRKPIIFLALCCSLLGWFPILYMNNIPTWLIVILFVVIGFASSAIVIGMAFVKESVPVPFAGTVSGISNMGMEMGPMILQPAIGCILDLKWNGSIARGIRIYDLNAYHTAFSLIIGLIISGIIIIHFARETFCRQLRQ